jgi:CRISPR type IV-associated protein Csf2
MSIESVFCYNGNAWRGQLRDLAALYMLEKLNVKVSLDAFHLLFSGGRIGGDQSIDLGQARAMRKAVPMIGVFGGGVGNQILPGKLRVSSSYPVCSEALPVLPHHLHDSASQLSYRQMTMEKSYTRRDDSKNDHITNAVMSQENTLLLDGPKVKKEGEASTQMRMTSELLIPGVRLHHTIDCMDMSEVELGVMVSAIYRFAESPFIGGQSNRGHGRVHYTSRILNTKTGDVQPFITLTDAMPAVGEKALEYKAAYDQHLQDVYDAILEKQGSEIKAMLGVA